MGEPTFHRVCQVSDVPVGESRMFVVAETMIGVINIDGEFFALANECPHAGASLAHGTIEGDVVSCRIHHWRFSVRDGTYLDENKPQCNAKCFPLQIVGNEIQVRLAAEE